MFINQKQAFAIARHLQEQGEQMKLGSFVINEHNHPLMGKIITIWSPFMDHFAVNNEGEFISPEDMQ